MVAGAGERAGSAAARSPSAGAPPSTGAARADPTMAMIIPTTISVTMA